MILWLNRNVLALALTLGCVMSAAWAQQPQKVSIVGNLMVGATPDDPMVEGLRRGLRELGYAEGRNLRFEFRTAQGNADRLLALAVELVALKADVVVVMSPQAARAMRQASPTVPIVAASFDPVDFDLATSLAVLEDRLQEYRRPQPSCTRSGCSFLRKPYRD